MSASRGDSTYTLHAYVQVYICVCIPYTYISTLYIYLSHVLSVYCCIMYSIPRSEVYCWILSLPLSLFIARLIVMCIPNQYEIPHFYWYWSTTDVHQWANAAHISCLLLCLSSGVVQYVVGQFGCKIIMFVLVDSKTRYFYAYLMYAWGE